MNIINTSCKCIIKVYTFFIFHIFKNIELTNIYFVNGYNICILV
jgi:hypothetical protein